MLPEQRRRKILELIQEHGSAKVAELKDLFSVTEPTIRQDLFKLEEEGHVVRQYGGAYLKNIPNQVKSMSLHNSLNMDKKARIAAKALEYIEDGDSIILDAGTTITEMAKRMVNFTNLNVITSALNIALTLGQRFNIHVMLTGGEFKPPTLSVTGEQAAKFFDNTIVAGKFFLSTYGITDDGVITYPGLSDIPLRKAMIGAAQEVYLVADSTKIGRVSLAALGGIETVQHLITDPGIDKRHVDMFKARGVNVIVSD